MLLLALALLVLPLLRRSSAAGSELPAPVPGDAAEALSWPAVWSLGSSASPRCKGRLPVIPAASSAWGTQVREGLTAPLVWGWTGPGQRATGEAYPGRLVADVETYVTASGAARWTGARSELSAAAWLAARCPAVTSHGFVAPQLREVLGVFARAGRVGIPQVYDSDKSTAADPRRFLRDCVRSYEKAGFQRVVPLLGLTAGQAIVAEWVDECGRLGLNYHIWSLQRLLEGQEADCAIVAP